MFVLFVRNHILLSVYLDMQDEFGVNYREGPWAWQQGLLYLKCRDDMNNGTSKVVAAAADSRNLLYICQLK